jgi:hypothetical protein
LTVSDLVPAVAADDAKASARSLRKRKAPLPVGLGAGGLAIGSFQAGSVMPGTALGLQAFVELATGIYGTHRLNGLYFFEGNAKAASFRAIGARWDIAPFRIPVSRATDFEPCVAAMLMRVTARVRPAGDITAGSATRTFVAGDLLARFRYRPTGALLVSLEAGAEVPLTRYVFRLGTAADDHGIIHQVPALGWMLGFALGAALL